MTLRPSDHRASRGIPTVSRLDGFRYAVSQLLPNFLAGLFYPRRFWVGLLIRFHPDPLGVQIVSRLRRKFGQPYFYIKLFMSKNLVVLDPDGIRRVLDNSPEIYGDPQTKRRGMSHSRTCNEDGTSHTGVGPMTHLDKMTSRKRYSAAPATLLHRLQRSTFALALALFVASCDDSPDLGLGEEHVQPDEAEVTREMIRLIKEVSLERPKIDGLVKRFNQAKSLGCFDATFTVADALPEKLARGLFSKPATYPAILRIANASTEDDRKKDLRGLSVKIPEITDADLTGGETPAQDFLFNSYPALFAATPEDFLSFIEATADDRRWLYFLSHPKSLWILFKARDTPASPFDIRYWSTTPYRYGDDSTSAVKYSLKSCSTVTTDQPDEPDAGHLSSAMANHLQRAPACFAFMVQFQSDAEVMPIEDASVIWDEDISPFTTVATIVVEDQEFQDANSMAECEAMSFNPWNALSAHKPLGGMNRVRKELYDEIAEFRAQQNSQP